MFKIKNLVYLVFLLASFNVLGEVNITDYVNSADPFYPMEINKVDVLQTKVARGGNSVSVSLRIVARVRGGTYEDLMSGKVRILTSTYGSNLKDRLKLDFISVVPPRNTYNDGVIVAQPLFSFYSEFIVNVNLSVLNFLVYNQLHEKGNKRVAFIDIKSDNGKAYNLKFTAITHGQGYDVQIDRIFEVKHSPAF